MDDMTTPQDESPQQAAESPAQSAEPAPQPPVEPAPPSRPAPTPIPPAKPKTNVGFFILGLFAPYVIGGIILGLMTALSNAMMYSDATAPLFGVLGIAMNSITPLLFFAFLAAWLIGKQKGNVRLASFGKGGMWAYAIGALLALLAFGTCIIALGTGGSM